MSRLSISSSFLVYCHLRCSLDGILLNLVKSELCGRYYVDFGILGNSMVNHTRAAKLRLLNFLSLFRDLQKPTRFSGGGGSSRIFPGSPRAYAGSVGGGGVVAGFSRDLQLRNQIFTQH